MKKISSFKHTYFLLIVIMFSCNNSDFDINNYKDLKTTKQISVYTMQVDGKDFYNAYKSSDYMLFTFGTSGGAYTIECNLLSASTITPLTLATYGNPQLIPDPAATSDFNLESSQLSDDNINKFFKKLISKGFKFDNETNAGNYYIIFQVDKVDKVSGIEYARIKITAVQKAAPHSTSSRYVNPNPCPPCRTTYSGN